MNNDINRLDNVFDELGNVHNSETLNENLNDLESNVDKLVALGLRKIEEFKSQKEQAFDPFLIAAKGRKKGNQNDLKDKLKNKKK